MQLFCNTKSGEEIFYHKLIKISSFKFTQYFITKKLSKDHVNIIIEIESFYILIIHVMYIKQANFPMICLQH